MRIINNIIQNDLNLFDDESTFIISILSLQQTKITNAITQLTTFDPYIVTISKSKIMYIFSNIYYLWHVYWCIIYSSIWTCFNFCKYQILPVVNIMGGDICMVIGMHMRMRFSFEYNQFSFFGDWAIYSLCFGGTGFSSPVAAMVSKSFRKPKGHD